MFVCLCKVIPTQEPSLQSGTIKSELLILKPELGFLSRIPGGFNRCFHWTEKKLSLILTLELYTLIAHQCTTCKVPVTPNLCRLTRR